MATTIVVACPSCRKQLKGPAEIRGKKVRCKACGHSFTVSNQAAGAKTAPVPEKPVPATKVASQPARPPAAAVAKSTDDEIRLKASQSMLLPPETKPPPVEPAAQSDSRSPYQLTPESEGVKRCPQCAFQMDEDAVICLECGFNTQTRMRLSTIMAYETTPADRAKWLMPGILCAIVLFLMLGAIVFLWVAFRGLDDSWVFPLQVWGSIVAAFIGWFTGRFAYKRLIKNPTPPENLKK